MLIIGRLVIGRLAVFVCGTLLFAMTPVSAADNLKIGMVAEITTSSGATSVEEQQVNGAKLAIHEVNGAGGVLGRPMELIVEDIGGTEAGAVSAFGRLAGDPEIAAFIGPDRSAFVH